MTAKESFSLNPIPPSGVRKGGILKARRRMPFQEGIWRFTAPISCIFVAATTAIRQVSREWWKRSAFRAAIAGHLPALMNSVQSWTPGKKTILAGGRGRPRQGKKNGQGLAQSAKRKRKSPAKAGRGRGVSAGRRLPPERLHRQVTMRRLRAYGGETKTALKSEPHAYPQQVIRAYLLPPGGSSGKNRRKKTIDNFTTGCYKLPLCFRPRKKYG